jgi:hypothetical protein
MVTSPRASSRNFPIAPEAYYADLEMLLRREGQEQVFRQFIEWIRQIAVVGNGTQAGRTNNLGTFTLATSAATTTLSDKRISAKTVVEYWPTTANASAEKGNGTIYQTYPNTTEGQAVINHANSATADRTFAYLLFG